MLSTCTQSPQGTLYFQRQCKCLVVQCSIAVVSWVGLVESLVCVKCFAVPIVLAASGTAQSQPDSLLPNDISSLVCSCGIDLLKAVLVQNSPMPLYVVSWDLTLVSTICSLSLHAYSLCAV